MMFARRIALVLYAVVGAACAPQEQAAPDAGWTRGDPTGRSPAQDLDGETPLGLVPQMPEAPESGLHVLFANVGNVDVYRCDSSVFKLCAQEAEEAIRVRLAEIRPDIVALSELITQEVCEGAAEWPAWHVCHPSFGGGERSQARRLLGPGYTIVCETRKGYECVGVRTGAGRIAGCEEGALCRNARSMAPVDGCDDGFTLSAVTVEWSGRTLDVINAHPPSDSFSARVPHCRVPYLKAALEPQGVPESLRKADVAIFGGDLNFDPYRAPATDADVQYWNERVSLSRDDAARAFALHSGAIEHDPPYWTTPLLRRTLDHVTSVGMKGRCRTLGAAKDHPALDRNTGTELQRLDHLAQWCLLDFQ